MSAGGYQRKEDMKWLRDRKNVLKNKIKHQIVKGDLIAIEDESVFQNWVSKSDFEELLYIGATGIYYQSK